MFPEGVIFICGVQINCKGNESVDEILIDEAPVGIPICQDCKDTLDSR